MRKDGNGRPEVCVYNLLRTARYEVPYERIKGIDASLIGRPSADVMDDFALDVEFLIETYEKRLTASQIELVADLTRENGHFDLSTVLSTVQSMEEGMDIYE